MADTTTNKKTTLSGEEVIARSVQFFATRNWRTTSQSARAATFEGKQGASAGSIIIALLGFLLFIIPGIIASILLLARSQKIVQVVVTANPNAGGSEVSVSCPNKAKSIAKQFLDALPA